MKISYFNYHYYIEGTSRGAAAKIRSIASWLERLGHEVDLQFRWTSLDAGEKGDGTQPRGLKRIKWLRRWGHVPRRLWRNRRFRKEEKKLLRAFRPDVLLSLNAYCYYSALQASRKLGIPFVLFCDAPLEYEYSKFHTQFHSFPRIGRWIEGINLRGADQVICISEILKGYLMRYGVEATKLHVIPNGVDHHAFKPGPKDEELVARFGLGDRVVVGFVGSFNFFADTESFACSIKTLCQRHPEAVFFFVGKGKASDEIAEAGAGLGLSERLIFAGAVPHDEVSRYLSTMDVVISPYRGDYLFYGSPLKLLEYMAAGKPALVTALGQIKEVILDGHNGMLFEWGDDETMVRKLSLLIADGELRRRLGANARKTIEAGWTWELQASRIAEVLKSAIDNSEK